MKIMTPRVLMLATALLGGGTMLTSALPASAAPRYGRPGYRPGQGNRNRLGASRNFNGIVTRVRSNKSFDLRVGGNTYNVYTNSRLPRRLNTGDRVRVNGFRQDNNDIRYAAVAILRNR